jgi:archaellin
MNRLRGSIVLVALLLTAAVPAFAGIHYKATTTTQDAQAKNNTKVEVEGWVSGDNAKVLFKESGGNPMAKSGSYIITKNGGQTLYLVDPEEKTYMEWDLNAMLGFVGAMTGGGMGPLLKMEFSDPKVEQLGSGDGGTLVGLPTQQAKFRTSYTMKVKVFGMGSESSVVSEQEVWTTNKLQDRGFGVWLRSNPRTGNPQLDKLIEAEMKTVQGFPLKTHTVTTTTDKKKNRQTVTTTTTEVTQLDANASVPASAFEIPAGYEETEMPALVPPQGRN